MKDGLWRWKVRSNRTVETNTDEVEVRSTAPNIGAVAAAATLVTRLQRMESGAAKGRYFIVV